MDFKPVDQTESSITLQWSAPVNSTLSSFNYTLQFEAIRDYITGGPGEIMNYTVKGLEPARRYYFTLYTIEQESNSSGVSISALTGEISS